jgi:IS5 family transposase
MAQKNNVNHFGYKNHIKIDAKSKIITKYEVTSANVHDSQVIDDLLDKKDKGGYFYADSAYTGGKQEQIIAKKEMVNCVHEKGYRANPLTEEQKLNNTEKSRTRARVEYIFGFMENSMNQMYLQFIGFKRINAAIGLMNLTYNMFRKIQLQTN